MGLDSPFAILLLIALPDSLSLLAVTPSIVRESILYLNVAIAGQVSPLGLAGQGTTSNNIRPKIISDSNKDTLYKIS